MLRVAHHADGSTRRIHLGGWKKQFNDPRDAVYAIKMHGGLTARPSQADLRSICSPIEDQGELGSCHDDQTEVLTRTGWKKFADCVEANDELATVNSSTRELSYERPTRYVRFPYDGTMVRGTHKFIDFLVTPDHKMVVRKWDQENRRIGDDYSFLNAKDLGWYSGLLSRVQWNGIRDAPTTFLLEGVDHKHKPQREDAQIPMVAWLRLIGIYLAEGTVIDEENHYKVQLAGSKDRERTFIHETLTSLGIKASDNIHDRICFNNKRIWMAMDQLGLRGVKAPFKFVPAFVFDQPASMIKEFLLGHFMGDGSEQDGLRVHYTVSEQLAKDLQRLIFLSGNESYVSIREPRFSTTTDGREIHGKYPEHRVSVCEQRTSSIDRAEHITEEHYAGDVFCAEVPTHHTLVTRRKGKILISGNCTAHMAAALVEANEGKRAAGGIQAVLAGALPTVGVADVLVANGVISFKTTIQPAPTPAPPSPPSPPSPPRLVRAARLFQYYATRKIEGSVSEDSGASIRDAVKAMNLYGVGDESLYPYDVTKFAVNPPQNVWAAAATHKVTSYHSIADGDLESIKAVIASGFLVGFGFNVYDNFMSAAMARTGILHLPGYNDAFQGGHAVAIVGYDDSVKQFIVRNSWGLGWGLHGYFMMDYAYLANTTLSSDLWAVNSAPI